MEYIEVLKYITSTHNDNTQERNDADNQMTTQSCHDNPTSPRSQSDNRRFYQMMNLVVTLRNLSNVYEATSKPQISSLPDLECLAPVVAEISSSYEAL